MARKSKTFEPRPKPPKRRGVHKKSKNKAEKRHSGKSKNRGQGK